MYCLLRPCFQLSFKLFSRIKLKHVCTTVAIIFILDFFGLFTHFFEKTYDESFAYPYEGDIHEFVDAIRHNKKPDLSPINEYNFSFIHDIREKCLDTNFQVLRLVFLVKSSVENFNRRMAIRNSWGFEKRFSDVSFKTVFLLGIHHGDDELKAKINFEAAKYRDIVQAEFYDAYYNNTIKTMMGFKWAVNYCSNSKYYMFVDDDIYVSVKNILKFIRNPALYPDNLKDSIKLKDVEHLKYNYRRSIKEERNVIKQDFNENLINILTNNNNNTENNRLKQRAKRQVFDLRLPDDVRLFTGYVMVTAPHRHKTSKWYVSLKEYPYHLWPPYVTAGAYILSKEALLDLYYGSMYTKHFRFDDIFLGIVAKKMDIEPFHCEEFHFYKKDYTKYNYKYVITSHGYDNPDELLQVWNEQKAMGNA